MLVEMIQIDEESRDWLMSFGR